MATIASYLHLRQQSPMIPVCVHLLWTRKTVYIVAGMHHPFIILFIVDILFPLVFNNNIRSSDVYSSPLLGSGRIILVGEVDGLLLVVVDIVEDGWFRFSLLFWSPGLEMEVPPCTCLFLETL